LLHFRAAEETVINLQMEIEQYKENELTLHQQLAKLVTQAEKTLADKNALKKLVSPVNVSKVNVVINIC